MNVLYGSLIAELGIIYLPFDTPVMPVIPLGFYQVGQQFICCIIIGLTCLQGALKSMVHAEEL
jgi:hypothetical protein